MRTLIVNLGPPGDVVRTTVLLRELKGEIYWLTKKGCAEVLLSKNLKRVLFLESEDDVQEVRKMDFDLVISLNEEIDALNVVKEIKAKKLIGAFLNEKGEVDYTKESSYWFDMSLSSKYGQTKADELKARNSKPLPQILIEMIGGEWKGQEYDLGIEGRAARGRVGMINLVTGKWPNKGWAYYAELSEILKKEGFDVQFLGKRPSIEEHINDINSCELIVCGDTLGMHVALALKKKVVALFNCTSPDEIYDYGRMVKVVSPLLKKYFYQKDFDEKAIAAIKVEDVQRAIKKVLNA